MAALRLLCRVITRAVPLVDWLILHFYVEQSPARMVELLQAPFRLRETTRFHKDKRDRFKARSERLSAYLAHLFRHFHAFPCTSMCLCPKSAEDRPCQAYRGAVFTIRKVRAMRKSLMTRMLFTWSGSPPRTNLGRCVNRL